MIFLNYHFISISYRKFTKFEKYILKLNKIEKLPNSRRVRLD
jgi:hypothetical protein